MHAKSHRRWFLMFVTSVCSLCSINIEILKKKAVVLMVCAVFLSSFTSCTKPDFVCISSAPGMGTGLTLEKDKQLLAVFSLKREMVVSNHHQPMSRPLLQRAVEVLQQKQANDPKLKSKDVAFIFEVKTQRQL